MNKLQLLIIVLIVIIFPLLIYILLTLNNKKNKSKELELKSQLEEANNEIEQLRAILKEQFQELNDLRNLMPIPITSGENTLSDIDKENNINFEIKIQNITLSSNISQYFTVPSSNGTFNPLHAKDFDDGNCYYKVEFTENFNSIGKLYFISSNRDKVAIHAYNDYLTKVCEIINFSDRNVAQNIQMISTGTVNLINNLWTIDLDKKVKIKFI